MSDPKEIAPIAAVIGFFAFAGLCVAVSDDAMNWTRYGLLGAGISYAAMLVIGHVNQQVLAEDDTDENASESTDHDDSDALEDQDDILQGSDRSVARGPERSESTSPSVSTMPEPVLAGAGSAAEAKRVNHAPTTANTSMDKEPSGDQTS
jgi:hypothetical protein